MIIKQASVFVENKPGRLADITDIIAKADCSIIALSIADTTHFGILRLIVDNHEKAFNALRENGFTVSSTNVINVKVDDRPGGLASVLRLLADNNIPVEYMYAYISKTDNMAQIVMRIEDDEKAQALLAKAGY